MATGTLESDMLFAAAIALAGGLLVVSLLVTGFAVVGQVLVKVRCSRAARFGGSTAAGIPSAWPHQGR